MIDPIDRNAAIAAIQKARGAMFSGKKEGGWPAFMEDELHALPAVTADPLGAEWMPIEMAPKDGTKIIIWRKEWDVFPVASWGDYPGNPASDSDENDVWMGGWLFSEFLTLGEEEGFLGWDTDEMPTHWQAIPGPTDADLDAAALARPKVQALVDAAEQAIGHLTGYGETSTVRINLRAALAALPKGVK